jgi:hypothetical protein
MLVQAAVHLQSVQQLVVVVVLPLLLPKRQQKRRRKRRKRSPMKIWYAFLLIFIWRPPNQLW